MRKTFLLLAFTSLLVACGESQDEKDIKSLIASWVEAEINADVNKFISLINIEDDPDFKKLPAEQQTLAMEIAKQMLDAKLKEGANDAKAKCKATGGKVELKNLQIASDKNSASIAEFIYKAGGSKTGCGKKNIKVVKVNGVWKLDSPN